MGLMRASALCVLGVVVALSASACAGPPQKRPAPLAAVAPLPAQTSLPSWIASTSPHAETEPGAQILIRFKNNLVPLEALEAADRGDLLAHFRLEPAVPGRFTVWTPRMVGFAGEALLPKATRFRVTLVRGLGDQEKNALASDYAWTFTTEPIALTPANCANGKPPDASPLELRPVLVVDSNVE